MSKNYSVWRDEVAPVSFFLSMLALIVAIGGYLGLHHPNIPVAIGFFLLSDVLITLVIYGVLRWQCPEPHYTHWQG